MMPDQREYDPERGSRAADALPPGLSSLISSQKGMWLAQRFGPKRAVFNIAELIEIEGAVDVDAFYRAVKQVNLEVPATRLRFTEIEGEPWQWVSPEPGVMMPFTDLSHRDDPRAAALALMQEEFQRPHDPQSDVLFIMGLFKLAEDRYFWYQRGHHICFDGYTGGLISRRIAEIYSRMVFGEVPAFTPFPYIEELLHEEELYHRSERFAADRAYWMAEFADKPAPTSLSATRPSMDGSLRRHTLMLDADFVDGLRTTAASVHCTFPQLMIAAIAIYLSRMTGLEDLVLGLPVTARSNGRLRRIPCMLANAVPLRLRIKPGHTTSDVMRHVAKRVREALRHQRYRYEDIRRDLNLSGSRHLFTTVVNIEPFDYDLRLGDAPTRIQNLCNGSIEDLAFFVFDRGERKPVQIDLDANPAIYRESVLEQHAQRLQRLLREISTRIESPIATIEIAGPEEIAAVLAYGAPPALAPALRFMPEDFERQAAETPWAVAVSSGHESITYRALDQRANQIANAIAARGAGSNRVAAVCVPRSIDLVASLLGVMKSGAAYLPLDPEMPLPRLRSMLRDAMPDVVIATHQTAPLVAPHPILQLDDGALHGAATTWKRPPLSAQQAAYLIYTSGSTGKPKGVVLSRANLANFLGAMAQEIPLDPSDRLLAVTTISFDIAALEIYLPLISGARVILAPKGLLTHPPALARLIAACGATVMQATPSLWDTLTGAEAESLRDIRILTGGEPLSPRLAARLRDIGAEVINLYGPTETAVWSALQRVADPGDVAIGRPIARTQLLVLDGGLRPTPEGIAGDLYIAGAGVAHGYLSQPALTAERFVANPHGPPGTLMYRSGDIARFERGVLHYLGRADDQIKIRGFRVELAEIEGELASEPGVARAAVVMRDGRLTGYLVPRVAEIPLDAARIKEALRERLPEYFVPSTLMILPELPLTPSGKLDRRALPAPDGAPVASGRTQLTATEEILIALFCEKLGLADLGVEANIFDLGADSLTVAKIIANVRVTFAVDLPLASVYENSTVAGFAALIDAAESRRAAIGPQVRPARIPLSSSQLRMLHAWQTPGIGAAYNMNLGLILKGPLDLDALEAAAGDVTKRHEALRTIVDLRLEEPGQIIIAADDARIRIMDEGTVAVADLVHAMNLRARRPFDITAELPLRLHRWQIAEQVHGVLAVVHHIAADGASLAPLAADLSRGYAARLAGLAAQWQPLPLQYADYALWEREQGAALTSHLTFWREALDGVPPQIRLPTDRPHPPRIGFEGGLVPIQLSAALHTGLLRLARACGASLFMVLQAGLAALLHRLGAGTDIPIGSPVAGRSDGQLDALIGCFYNVLVLRTDLSGNPAFTTLIHRVRSFNLRAYAHQDAPFDRIVEALGIARPADRHPLFQVMLSFQNLLDQKFDMANVTVTTVPVHTGGARYDLTVNVSEQRTSQGQPAGIVGGLEFRSDLFLPAGAARLAGQLEALLASAVADPALRIDELRLDAAGSVLEAMA